MTWSEWLLVSLAALALIWAGVVVALVPAGRGADARALAGFIPNCLVLMRWLLADQCVPRRRKLLLVGLVAYLALPFDLVPDFIPIAGQLDDVIVVALVLRSFVRADGGALLREHWPGPERSLARASRRWRAWLTLGRLSRGRGESIIYYTPTRYLDRRGRRS
jgi:uncharacterized membrane protein YkvA (DUF1232 family)